LYFTIASSNAGLGVLVDEQENAMWIDITDCRPTNGQKVLVAAGTVVTAASVDLSCYGDGRIWWDSVGCGGHDFEFDFANEAVTHWMPIPEPPNPSFQRTPSGPSPGHHRFTTADICAYVDADRARRPVVPELEAAAREVLAVHDLHHKMSDVRGREFDLLNDEWLKRGPVAWKALRAALVHQAAKNA
jgi:hypothetical protein